ncbi:MAG TPA: hypothetical protein VGB31_08350 [Myxococcota bacterium]
MSASGECPYGRSGLGEGAERGVMRERGVMGVYSVSMCCGSLRIRALADEPTLAK